MLCSCLAEYSWRTRGAAFADMRDADYSVPIEDLRIIRSFHLVHITRLRKLWEHVLCSQLLSFLILMEAIREYRRGELGLSLQNEGRLDKTLSAPCDTRLLSVEQRLSLSRYTSI